MLRYSRRSIHLNYLKTVKFIPKILYKDSFECTSVKVKNRKGKERKLFWPVRKQWTLFMYTYTKQEKKKIVTVIKRSLHYQS